MPVYDSVAIIGVGLIGGSIGLALRDRKLVRSVIGIGRRPDALETAKKLGAVDEITTDLTVGVAHAEICVICSPVDTVSLLAEKAAGAASPNSIITDAGSTKAAIVRAIDERLASRNSTARFVGSHPIAGDHRTGAMHSRGDLFEGRTVVVTPSPSSNADAVAKISEFWRNLGAQVVSMSPDEHDAALAATSHLPHLIASALAATTPRELLPLTAGGWRDTTRVAEGDPQLWRPIFTSNQRHVLEALQQFEARLSLLKEALAAGDDRKLEQLLLEAKQTRDALGD